VGKRNQKEFLEQDLNSTFRIGSRKEGSRIGGVQGSRERAKEKGKRKMEKEPLPGPLLNKERENRTWRGACCTCLSCVGLETNREPGQNDVLSLRLVQRRGGEKQILRASPSE